MASNKLAIINCLNDIFREHKFVTAYSNFSIIYSLNIYASIITIKDLICYIFLQNEVVWIPLISGFYANLCFSPSAFSCLDDFFGLVACSTPLVGVGQWIAPALFLREELHVAHISMPSLPPSNMKPSRRATVARQWCGVLNVPCKY